MSHEGSLNHNWNFKKTVLRQRLERECVENEVADAKRLGITRELGEVAGVGTGIN